jgi:hypothetical protein
MLGATLHYGIDPGIPMYFDGLAPQGHAVDQVADDPSPQPSDDIGSEFDF